jgi:hypothetical protein
VSKDYTLRVRVEEPRPGDEGGKRLVFTRTYDDHYAASNVERLDVEGLRATYDAIGSYLASLPS